jgi:hypothetical protein
VLQESKVIWLLSLAGLGTQHLVVVEDVCQHAHSVDLQADQGGRAGRRVSSPGHAAQSPGKACTKNQAGDWARQQAVNQRATQDSCCSPAVGRASQSRPERTPSSSAPRRLPQAGCSGSCGLGPVA